MQEYGIGFPQHTSRLVVQKEMHKEGDDETDGETCIAAAKTALTNFSTAKG